MMKRSLPGWLVLTLLLGTIAYALAEEITLTTYYPSPRGVYDQLRTAGNVQIGRIDPPDDPDPNTAPRLHIYRERNGMDLSNAPLLLLEDERPNSGNNPDPTPLIIDENGNVGIGVSGTPQATLDVAGGIKVGTTTANGPAGILRWNNGALEAHDGSGWAPVGGVALTTTFQDDRRGKGGLHESLLGDHAACFVMWMSADGDVPNRPTCGAVRWADGNWVMTAQNADCIMGCLN